MLEKNSEVVKDAILGLLDAEKTEDIQCFPLINSSLADYIIIASCMSARQLDAIADKLLKLSKESKFPKPSVEGKRASGWVIIDLGGVVVHLFMPEFREQYKLEELF